MSAIAFVGPVDHGKSTLIGRLLLASGALPKTEQARLESLEQQIGLPGALVSLLDSLQVERDGLFTLDTTRRVLGPKGFGLTIIDTPGHQELLSNMLTGVSCAQAAVLVLDVCTLVETSCYSLASPDVTEALANPVRHTRELEQVEAKIWDFARSVTNHSGAGILSEITRYAEVLSFLDLKNPGVALTKVELLPQSANLSTIIENLKALLAKFEVIPRWIIPVSAVEDINISHNNFIRDYSASRDDAAFGNDSRPNFLAALRSLLPDSLELVHSSFRLLVQGIDPDGGVSGRVISGEARWRDHITVWPSGQSATIKHLLGFPRHYRRRAAGDFASLALELCDASLAKSGAGEQKESSGPKAGLRVGRGSLVCGVHAHPMVLRSLLGRVLWLEKEAPRAGAVVVLSCGYQQATARIEQARECMSEPLALWELEMVLPEGALVWEDGIPALSRFVLGVQGVAENAAVAAMGMICAGSEC